MTKPNQPPADTATLSIQHLTTLELHGPIVPATIMATTTEQSRELQLSHLRLLPRPLDAKDDPSVVPTVLGVYTYFSEQTAASNMTYSLLSRWELREEKPSVDSSFASLSTKKSTSTELKVSHLF